MRDRKNLAMLCTFLFLIAGVAASQFPDQRQTAGHGGYTRVISPVAVVTVITSGRSSVDRVLELIVLWRGSPGWFFRASGHSSSGGGSGTKLIETARYGDVQLDLDFDYSTRLLSIGGGKPIALKDANVVLVDGVDKTDGMTTVGTLRVAGTIADDSVIEPVLKSSAQIVEFLRCDIRLDDPGRDAAVQRICAAILGK